MSSAHETCSEDLFIVAMQGGHSVSFRSQQLADAMMRFLAKRGIDAELLTIGTMSVSHIVARSAAADRHYQPNAR